MRWGKRHSDETATLESAVAAHEQDEAAEYRLRRDAARRLRETLDGISRIGRGDYTDLVEIRVAASSMAATLQRVLEDDLVPVARYAADHDDRMRERYPDEGKPIPEWDERPPADLPSPAELLPLIDLAWFRKKDGTRYQPSQHALQVAKSLVRGDECDSSDHARFYKAENGGFEDDDFDYCPQCDDRQSCVCEEAWAMNGPTLQFHPDGYLDKNRQWQRHGLPTIGEIQAERHPVLVCDCPWDKCPVRDAAGFADWKAEYLIGL